MEYIQQNEDVLNGNPTSGSREQEVYDWLTEHYRVLGDSLPKLRKEMKAAGYTVPLLVVDFFDGRVVFRRNAAEYIDRETNQKVYSLKNIYGLREYGYFTEYDVAGYYKVYKRDSHLVSQRYAQAGSNQTYHLLDWIAYGVECDCGNHFISPNGETDCPVCRERHIVREYSARAEDILGSEETNERLFGIELEYENVTGKHVGTHLAEHAIAKKDSTIKSGVEVVTRPACVKTHKKALLAFFDAVTTKAASNTGMHIHVSKKGIGQIQLGMLLLFMNRAENIPFITKVAGRYIETNTYCKPISGVSITYNVYSDPEVFRSVTRTSTSKYAPLNTAKPQTIEFRIFRSPESHLEMSAKLDFVKALVEYASPYAVTCAKTLKEKANVPVFLDFVKRNKKDYPDFVTYFKEEIA